MPPDRMLADRIQGQLFMEEGIGTGGKAIIKPEKTMGNDAL
jgi:hypothetical protein